MLVEGLQKLFPEAGFVTEEGTVANDDASVSRDECFRGAEGQGAFLNDKPIRVSTAASTEDTLIATGLPFYKFDHMDAYMAILTEYAQHSRGIRRWGSAATDLAYVACGRFDSYFEFNINAYDVAAGILL
nr:phosphatase IMPL1, chloroplastic [Tanacetum cinerariifolium]